MSVLCRIPVILISVLCASPGRLLIADDSDSTNASVPICSLTIQSTPDSARVVIDGKRIGFTPVVLDSLTAGVHILTLQHPDAESWLTGPTSDTVHVSQGEHKTLRYNLGPRFFITSTPFGAEVFVGDSLVGTTPTMAPSWLETQSITLRKPGYEPAIVQLTANQRGIISIPMSKLWQYDGNGEQYFKDYDGSAPKSAALYISGGATILSGIAAAYLKIKADDRYQLYLNTGNGTLLTQTRRLDAAAAIAIVSTQIGLGLFTYFLFTQ